MSTPPTFDHVVGQQSAVRQLKTAVDAYFHSRSLASYQPFPHTLITGPAGTGKTLLSELIAQEICVNLQIELAQNLTSQEAVRAALMSLEPEDCLFIDEIHELKHQVTLYRAVEERKLFIGKKHAVDLPPFTLIGATTHEYKLSRSMRDRFLIHARLSHYSPTEMVHIVNQRASRSGILMEPDAIREVANRSRGVPRIAVRLLEASQRVANACEASQANIGHVRRMCSEAEIDSLGFDFIEQRYLKNLREEGTVRLNMLASALGIPTKSVATMEEDFVRLGLVTKSDKGRMLTPKGVEHLISNEENCSSKQAG